MATVDIASEGGGRVNLGTSRQPQCYLKNEKRTQMKTQIEIGEEWKITMCVKSWEREGNDKDCAR